jgi:hypothetical protein
VISNYEKNVFFSFVQRHMETQPSYQLNSRFEPDRTVIPREHARCLILRLDECIGLFSSAENAWARCFREADLNEAAVRRTHSRALGQQLGR